MNKKVLIAIKKIQAQGQYEKAYKLYEAYYPKMKEDPEFLNSFGYLCFRIDKKEKAKELWKDAIVRYMQLELLDEARAVLRKLIRNFPEEKKERYWIALESKDHEFIKSEIKPEDFSSDEFLEILKSRIKKDPEVLKVVSEVFPDKFREIVPRIMDEELQALITENPTYMEFFESFLDEESLLRAYFNLYENTKDKSYLRKSVKILKKFFESNRPERVAESLAMVKKPVRKIAFMEFLKAIELTDSIMQKFLHLFELSEDPIFLLPFLYKGKESLRKLDKDKLKILRDYLYNLGDLKVSSYISEIIKQEYDTTEKTHLKRVAAWKEPVGISTPGKLSVLRACENMEDINEIGLYTSCYLYRHFAEIKRELPLLALLYFPDVDEENRDFVFKTFSGILRTLRPGIKIFDMRNLLLFGFPRMRVGDANLLKRDIENALRDAETRERFLFSLLELKTIPDVNVFSKKLAELTVELEEGGKPTHTFELSTAYLLNKFESIFVNREKEFGIILGMNRGFVLIEGQTGLGKTYFLEHLYLKLRDKYPVLLLRCQDIFSQVPFASLKAAIQDFRNYRKVEAEGIKKALGEFYPTFYEYFISPEAKTFESQPEAKFKIFESFYLAIKSFVDDRGYILIDDIQWIDAASMELLAYVLKRGIKVILCATYNPETENKTILARLEGFPGVRKITLDPFREKDIQEYFHALFAGAKVDKATVERILDTTGGIPLLINELMINLLSEDGIKIVGNKLQLNLKKLPKYSAVELIKNRLSLLDEFTTEVLQFASCLGRMFRVSDLINIMNTDKFKLFKALEKAVVKGFLKEIGGHQFDFQFTSMLHYDAVYASIPPFLKKEFHREIAQYIELTGGSPEHAANHYIAAQDYTKGLELLIRAFEVHEVEGLLEEHTDLIDKGISLLLNKQIPIDEKTRINFLERLIPILHDVGFYCRLEKILRTVLEDFKELITPEREKHFITLLLTSLIELGKFQDAEKLLEEKEELVFEELTKKELTPIKKALLRLYIYTGNVKEAQKLLEDFRQNMQEHEMFLFHFNQGLLYKVIGNYKEAEGCFYQSLEQAVQCNNIHFVARNLAELTRLQILKEDFEFAEQEINYFQERYRKFKGFVLRMELEKARLLFSKGDLSTSRSILEDLTEPENLENLNTIDLIRASEIQARIFKEWGLLKKARNVLNEVQPKIMLFGPVGLKARLLLFLANILEIQGDMLNAEKNLKEIEKVESQVVNPAMKTILLMEKIRFCLLKGKNEECEKLRKELGLIPEVEDPVIQYSREVLAELLREVPQPLEHIDPFVFINSKRLVDKLNYYLLYVQYLLHREETDLVREIISRLRKDLEKGFNLKEAHFDFMEGVALYMKGETKEGLKVIDRAQKAAKWMGNRFLNLLCGSIKEQILIEEEKFEEVSAVKKQKSKLLLQYPQLATLEKIYIRVPVIPCFCF